MCINLALNFTISIFLHPVASNSSGCARRRHCLAIPEIGNVNFEIDPVQQVIIIPLLKPKVTPVIQVSGVEFVAKVKYTSESRET